MNPINRSLVTGGITLLATVAALTLSTSAYADNLTFNVATGLITPGLFLSEGKFTYDAFSGDLYNDFARGNLFPAMEGSSLTGGGIMRIVRNDVTGGTFQFSATDVAQFNFGNSQLITFEGFRSGILKGTDFFTTSSLDGVFSTSSAGNLNGVAVDELRVILPANNIPQQQLTAVDNILLIPLASNAVTSPEPGSLILFGLAALPAIRILRRRKG